MLKVAGVFSEGGGEIFGTVELCLSGIFTLPSPRRGASRFFSSCSCEVAHHSAPLPPRQGNSSKEHSKVICSRPAGAAGLDAS